MSHAPVESKRLSNRMGRSIYKRILLTWALLLPQGIVLFIFFPVENDFSVLVHYAVCTLVGIVSFFISRRERDKGAKAIFFNLFLFFGLYTIISTAWGFVREEMVRLDPYSSVYAYEYSLALFHFLLSLCVVYLVVDSVLQGWKVYLKYLVTLTIVCSIWGLLYHPYLENPRYLYTTPDIEDLKEVKKAVAELKNQGKDRPTVEEISANARLYIRKDNQIVGELFGSKEEQRVAELLPYLESSNHIPLVYRPLFVNGLYFSLLCLAFIMIYFVYHYIHDPPKRAYVEKIVLLFLPYCAFEALHNHAFSTPDTLARYLAMDALGRYITTAVAFILLCVLILRLRFTLSVEGKFYEKRLINDPGHITRWRDSIDNWVVRKFLNPRILERRFLLLRRDRPQT